MELLCLLRLLSAIAFYSPPAAQLLEQHTLLPQHTPHTYLQAPRVGGVGGDCTVGVRYPST